MDKDEKAIERWDNEGGQELTLKQQTAQMKKTKNTELIAPISNCLLAFLPDDEYQRLLPAMEKVSLNYGESIYERGDVIGDVYFPDSGIISLLATVDDGAMLEVGIVGNEGMVGLSVFLGVETANNRAIVQGEGMAMKIKSADFLKECERGGTMPQILRRFTHSLMAQISQSAVCFRFHQVEARLARWLLMTADRMHSNEFQMTQDFLANMLGVRREAVNKSAVILQKQNLIQYTRGKMQILNRAKLEKTSCLCYSVIKAEEVSCLPNQILPLS